MKTLRAAAVQSLLMTVVAGCSGSSGFGLNPPTSPGPPDPPVPTMVSGTISGLTGSGLVLGNVNDNARLEIQPGATTFAFRPVPVGSGYFVRVVVQPSSPAQVCTTYFGSGSVGDANTNRVRIECTSDVGYLRGTIAGLKGSGLLLTQSNSESVQPLPGSTEFNFPSALKVGGRYSVGVTTQPVAPAQTCTIVRGKGLIADTSGVENVAIECLDNSTSPLSGTYLFEPLPGKSGYFTFFPDGTYSVVIRVENPACGATNGNGVEYGVYNWNAATGDFAIRSAVVDTNGPCGVADLTGSAPKLLMGHLSQSTDDGLQVTWGDEALQLSPVESPENSILGSFLPGTGAISIDAEVYWVNRLSGAFTVFASDGSYVSVETQDAASDGGAVGAEWGCYEWSPNELTATCGEYAPSEIYLDLNGTGGLSEHFRYGYGDINATLFVDPDVGEFLAIDNLPGYGEMESYWFKLRPE